MPLISYVPLYCRSIPLSTLHSLYIVDNKKQLNVSVTREREKERQRQVQRQMERGGRVKGGKGKAKDCMLNSATIKSLYTAV